MRISKSIRNELMILAAILLVAAIFRYWQIGSHPQAVHYDEVINGLVTQDLLRGILPELLTYDRAREPIIFYVMALPVWLLGPTPAALRIATASISLALVAGAYFLARQWFGRRVALLAALVCATTVWPIYHGRLATRSILVPLLISIALGFAVMAWRSNRWRHWLVAALAFGGVFYTYASNLFIVPAMLATLIVLWLYDRQALMARLKYVAVAAAIILAIATPITVFRFTHSATGPGRPIILSVFYPGQSPAEFVKTLAVQFVLIGRMFFLKGDFNIRHNIPWRPVFDFLMAVPFAVGVLLSFRKSPQRGARLLAMMWLAIWLIPSYMAKDAPHFLRSSGILAVLFIFPAMGLVWLAHGLRQHAGSLAALLLVGALVGGSFVITTRDYILSNFLSSPELFVEMNGLDTAPVLEFNRQWQTGWVGDNVQALPLPAGAPLPEHLQAAGALPQPYAQYLVPWLYDPSFRQY